ncbi:cupin domain-containing protein [Streptomyces sp. NPDC051546]|uniref:cupin domain-containing protein n=1 Tax=Streptomyces sp. NPDC051546 TaxID=3365655 RepID=UPI0037899CD8
MTTQPETARILGLDPHPEGGWYRRIYTSPITLPHPTGTGERPSATLIHYLLGPGEQSRWHTVASDEIWLWRDGGPLVLYTSPPGPEPTTITEQHLGSHREPGSALQVHVAAGHWQSARPVDDREVLVSCLVTPGFDFADFTLLAPVRIADTRLGIGGTLPARAPVSDAEKVWPRSRQ